MIPITFSKVYDTEGNFKHLELHQGSNVIEISLATAGTHRAGYRWSEVQESVDKLLNEMRETERHDYLPPQAAQRSK